MQVNAINRYDNSGLTDRYPTAAIATGNLTNLDQEQTGNSMKYLYSFQSFQNK